MTDHQVIRMSVEWDGEERAHVCYPDHREHDTDGHDCWCAPQWFVPCDDCDDGCWKCVGGLIELSRHEADAEDRPLLIVHRPR